MPGGTADEDDPFIALAQVKARRAMADLAGFPHHSSWDQLEADARARLRRDGGTAGATDRAPDPEPGELADPLLALAQVKAFRLAADSMGMAHDPAWDGTEESVASQLQRAADPHPADSDESGAP